MIIKDLPSLGYDACQDLQSSLLIRIYMLLTCETIDHVQSSVVAIGKSMSKSILSSKKSKSIIGELVTEVGVETISVISEVELCTLWPSPVLSQWQNMSDSEVVGDMNAGEKLSIKLFSIMEYGNMLLLSSFSDPIDGEEKQNDGNMPCLWSKSSTLTSTCDPKEKIFSGGCSIFSCCG